MKIIQLLGRIEGSGVTRYIIELRSGIRAAGHDVQIVYFDNNLKAENDMQNISDLVTMKYSQELIDLLNSSDIILINSLISIKATEEHRNNFYNLIKEVKGPVKALFCIDHNMAGIRSYYGDEYVKNPDLILKHIDKFVTFSPCAPVISKIKEYYPDIIHKYVHLHLLYNFADDDFIDFDKKYRRITYLGRIAGFKDPIRLLRCQKELTDANYQLEMRGILPTIGAAGVPNLLYELDDNGKKLGPSKYTVNLINEKLIQTNYPDQDPALIHYNDREKDKLYIFGRYRREDGMNAVKYSMFGCDFYWHKNPLAFGDTIEFCIAEIMDSGTIPFLDYSTGENCKCHKNGYRTNDSLLSKNAGVYLKYDCSNIDEVVEQLNYLSSNKTAYDEYRMNCFNVFKEHYNPIAIANRLVKDLTTEDNYDGLAEFGIKKLF